MNRKTTTVYWALDSTPDWRQSTMNMLWQSPVPLAKTLDKRDTGNYYSCSAFKDFLKNTFVLIAPQDVKAGFNEFGSTDNRFFVRASNFINRKSIEFDYGWFFFADDSVKIRVTPAYMHQTEFSKYGHIASGSFDISRWFRPIKLTLELWSGVDSVSIKSGEPIAYLEFESPNEIIFQQFHITEEILNESDACVNFKNFMPGISLNTMYDRFTRSNRNKRILDLISKTLVGEPKKWNKI